MSIYNKIVSYKNDYLIFNCVTGSLIKVNNSVGQKFINGNLEEFNQQSLIKMKKLGFVTTEEDEKKSLESRYQEIVNNHFSKQLYITTTDRCNLGCHYCFEEKNQWIKMSDDTQDALINFSKKFLTNTPTKFFRIVWYGGEPTMNMPAIIKLSKFFTDFCKEKDIEFRQDMITNGTTLTEHVCDVLFNCGLVWMQITIDGVKEDHDVSRPYLKDLTLDQMSEAQKNQIKKINPNLLLNVINNQQNKKNQVARSSFDQIMIGIKNWTKIGGCVSLRMNVNSQTLPKTTQLLDSIREEGLMEKNERGGYVYAYAHPIYDVGGNGSCGSGGGSGCGTCVSSMSMNDFSKKMHIIKDWYKKYKIETFDHMHQMFFTGDTCTANKKHEYVVNPDGTLTKCTHDVGIPERVIGSVYNDPTPDNINIPDTAYDRFNPFEDKECSACEVLPICLGGCKSNNRVGSNNNKYDAGCATVRYNYEEDIIRLYESQI